MNLPANKPIPTVCEHRWTMKDGTPITDAAGYSHPDAVRWHYRRPMTDEELAAGGSDRARSERVFISQFLDKRTLWRKLGDWLRMWASRPADAWRLVWIDRHPPTKTAAYDDSGDWAAKRWARALELAAPRKVS